MKFRIAVITFMCALLAVGALAQTAPVVGPSSPLDSITLPAYMMAGVACQQFAGCNGFVSGIVPETSKGGGFYGSVTADLSATKVTVNGKSGYALSPSFRFGEHKVLYNDTKATTDKNGVVTKERGNMLLIGGDVGAALTTPTNSSPTAVSIASYQVGLAGSLTITYIRQLSLHWAIGIPVRMLWINNVGPNGSGAWNPVVELGLIWKH